MKTFPLLPSRPKNRRTYNCQENWAGSRFARNFLIGGTAGDAPFDWGKRFLCRRTSSEAPARLW
jgi:hypothetical protein